MKKKMSLFLIAALAGTLLAGCGDKGTTDTTVVEGDDTATATGEDHLSRIKAAGKITIATEGVWSPFTYHDPDTDELVGFDVEVAAAIAEKLGVEADFKEVPFDGGLTGVSTGTFDMMANGVDVTEDRKGTYDFTDPYAYDHAVVITLATSEKITSFEDLAGLTTANSAGSTYEAMGKEYGATVSNVDTLGETMTLVLNGTVDATINANTSAQDYFKSTGTTELKVAAIDPEVTNYAIPLAKGNDNDTLREAINKAIAELRQEGKLSEISIKYFGADITKE
ncbi:transporter substrate-binding domain-containing protein [Butyrivibrio sp. AE3009]|uniref:transporter substrate-binding domain-containing protein n=1 Tax=Butyrivibrio sp. AE3009 TaxID=1280666 RepID=UPI0003B5E6AA|nr:transporter substrate-binding domain-containing protein [Butyrivibrio sp. AE3009]